MTRFARVNRVVGFRCFPDKDDYDDCVTVFTRRTRCRHRLELKEDFSTKLFRHFEFDESYSQILGLSFLSSCFCFA